MIYYPKIRKFEDFEYEKLKEFKEYCLSNGFKIPEIDEEILRSLHKKKMDVKSSYENILLYKKTTSELMPMTVN